MVLVVSDISYNALVKATLESYPCQRFLQRAGRGSILCEGLELDGVFFSCGLTMAIAMRYALDNRTVRMMLVDRV